MLNAVESTCFLILGALFYGLPGLLIQTAITGEKDPAVSLVISAWLFFTAAFACQLVGLPVVLWSVGGVVALVCLGAALAARRTPADAPASTQTFWAKLSTPERIWTGAGVLVCTGIFIGALAVCPLNTFDYPI